MQSPSLSSREVVEQIQQLVPPGSPAPTDSATLSRLAALTQDLIRAYQAGGRLAEDPFFDAWTRPLYLHETAVRSQVAGKTILVTGGGGYVGVHLIKTLLELGAARIVSVDNARCAQVQTRSPTQPDSQTQAGPQTDGLVTRYDADIRDGAALAAIFAAERPRLVFHLAAQRQPGLAETQVWETITSNVLGTQNVIALCEAWDVEQCIFSSTGKASRYVTAEIYAASKKMAEWLFAQAVMQGKVCYGMVRFTHMLNNSLMDAQITARVQEGVLVNVHAPERYVAGQNVGEAVSLLLNALVFSRRDRLQFLLVRNLGWPIESLEIALYKIWQSGQPIPIYFQGVLPGYEESFFLGQVDWDHQIDINTLINALETSNALETGFQTDTGAAADMIEGTLVPFDMDCLDSQIAALKHLCADATASPAALKQALADAVQELATSTFRLAAPEILLKILRWGVDPKKVARGDLKIVDHQRIIVPLVQCLSQRWTLDVVAKSGLDVADVNQMFTVLATLPAIQSDVAKIQAAIADLADLLAIATPTP